VVNDQSRHGHRVVDVGRSRVRHSWLASPAQAPPLLVLCLSFQHFLPDLPGGDFFGRCVGVPVRLHLSRPPAARMSYLPFGASDGPLLLLWHDSGASRAMRLTERCNEILRLLKAARWLTTSQLHRRFFQQQTANAARKRLRRLAEGGYIVKVQPNRMAEALFRLGPEGKRHLERANTKAVINLDRQPPKQLEHFCGVNDMRIAAEVGLPLQYFFAYWELPGIDWRQPIIPDAVFGVATGRAFAVEFDRGQENIRYFTTTKLNFYRRGLDGFPLERVLIITDRQARLESLAKAVGSTGARVLLTRLDLIQQHGLTAPIFFESCNGQGVKLL